MPDIEEEDLETTIQGTVKNGALIAGISLILMGIAGFFLVGDRIGGGMLILGFIVLVVPYAVISFLRTRQIREMEKEFPAFLKGLAESKRGGMTLLSAFKSAKETDYGKLNREVERVYNEMSWGVPFPKVMERFSERVEESPVMQQSLSIILQSFQSGGNITETIDSVAEEATVLRNIIEKKNSQFKQQMIIMYLIYFLFIGITVGLYIMLDQLLGLGSPEGALDNFGEIVSSGGTDINYCSDDILTAKPFCSIARIFGFIPADIEYGTQAAISNSYEKMAYYKSLLFTILMIQGISMSAVIGKISDGKASAGIKHAIILIPIAFVLFMFLVAPRGV